MIAEAGYDSYDFSCCVCPVDGPVYHYIFEIFECRSQKLVYDVIEYETWHISSQNEFLQLVGLSPF